MTEIYNIELCECCIGISYNGEWDSHEDCTGDQAHTPLSKLGPHDVVSLSDESPDPFFGINCDGCDMPLAGDRYECSLLKVG